MILHSRNFPISSNSFIFRFNSNRYCWLLFFNAQMTTNEWNSVSKWPGVDQAIEDDGGNRAFFVTCIIQFSENRNIIFSSHEFARKSLEIGCSALMQSNVNIFSLWIAIKTLIGMAIENKHDRTNMTISNDCLNPLTTSTTGGHVSLCQHTPSG